MVLPRAETSSRSNSASPMKLRRSGQGIPLVASSGCASPPGWGVPEISVEKTPSDSDASRLPLFRMCVFMFLFAQNLLKLLRAGLSFMRFASADAKETRRPRHLPLTRATRHTPSGGGIPPVRGVHDSAGSPTSHPFLSQRPHLSQGSPALPGRSQYRGRQRPSSIPSSGLQP
jgi:hypothetical protein